MPTFFAHETWFTSGPFPTDWSFAGETLTLVLLSAALAVTLVVRLVAHRFPGVDVPFLSRLAPWMPFAVQACVLIAGIPFNASLWFFGRTSWSGICRSYGAMLVL